MITQEDCENAAMIRASMLRNNGMDCPPNILQALASKIREAAELRGALAERERLR